MAFYSFCYVYCQTIFCGSRQRKIASSGSITLPIKSIIRTYNFCLEGTAKPCLTVGIILKNTGKCHKFKCTNIVLLNTKLFHYEVISYGAIVEFSWRMTTLNFWLFLVFIL
jgi:hypothetical protein